MTPEEKADRARQRMIEKAKEFQTGTYSNKFVAPEFQSMIRAEAGAQPPGKVLAIMNGTPQKVFRSVGQVVCVTCGKVGPWRSGIGGMHTGHFLGSRCFSILFDEENVAPQCSNCNRYRSGRPQEFRAWMIAVRGEDTIERLERLKPTTRQFTRAELVDMRIEFNQRTREAIEQMGGLL